MAGDKNCMLIRRRPSAATLVAIIMTLVIGTQTGFAAGSSRSDRDAPDPVRSVEVTATDGASAMTKRLPWLASASSGTIESVPRKGFRCIPGSVARSDLTVHPGPSCGPASTTFPPRIMSKRSPS